jgi:SAM-dependent methyltransferase
VSKFDLGWLSAREPCDHAVRSPELADRFAAALGATPLLIDLGCGTGSNLRYLAPRIAGPNRWHGVDNDPVLLRAAPRALRRWASDHGWATQLRGEDLILARPAGEIGVTFAVGDLARKGLPGDAGVAGVTGSALLDLTSARWLESFAEACRGTPLLMALSFDGRLAFEPAAPEDEDVRVRFVAHQRTDKGFGPALGPEAAAYLADRLKACGCAVAIERSDWQLGAADGALLRATVEGIIDAVDKIAPDRSLQRWAARRREQVANGDLRLTVGHVDLLALPG